MTPPKRGFPQEEFEARTKRAQSLMETAGCDALLLTTEPDIRYFTGFLTRFWESPTRPWFLILPASGKPVAVIPSIGAYLMGQTWIDDIRTWSSPNLDDDGIGLLIDTLNELKAESIGTPKGPETHLRMPLSDFERLAQTLPIKSDNSIMRTLRMVKSDLEIDKITQACAIAGRAFDRIPEILKPQTRFDQLFRDFQITCLQEGADNVPYLAGGHGPNGYCDVISPAKPEAIRSGDVVMLDTGLTFDGYFCDYDRNVALTYANPAATSGYSRLIDATKAALETARPGKTTADLFHVMDKILTGAKGGNAVGRLGHGLGMQLTEWPSITPQDHTELKPGMVLTLEPYIEISGGSGLVHEENILITNSGARMISPEASTTLPILT